MKPGRALENVSGDSGAALKHGAAGAAVEFRSTPSIHSSSGRCAGDLRRMLTKQHRHGAVPVHREPPFGPNLPQKFFSGSSGPAHTPHPDESSFSLADRVLDNSGITPESAFLLTACRCPSILCLIPACRLTPFEWTAICF